jgi:hypothetical protein
MLSSMRDLLLPRTDSGVLAQLLLVIVVTGVVIVVVRRERSLVTLTLGIGVFVIGLMGVRALH